MTSKDANEQNGDLQPLFAHDVDGQESGLIDTTSTGIRAITSQKTLSRSAADATWPPTGINWYYSDSAVAIAHGDCREILPSLPKVDLVLTDPPYFMPKASGRRLHAYADQRVAKGKIGGANAASSSEYAPLRLHGGVLDKELWEILRRTTIAQIVWGVNELSLVLGYAPRLLVWDKKLKNGWDDFHSDCEAAWCSEAGPARMYRHLWAGMLRDGDDGTRVHPTQKPIELMRWCLSFLPDGSVFDPFMGSGTTLRAAKDLGRKAIGIEIEEKYCEIAARRMEQEVLALDVPLVSSHQPELVDSVLPQKKSA